MLGRPPQPIQLDEEWLAEWIDFGYKQLLVYLWKVSRYERWCGEHDRTP